MGGGRKPDTQILSMKTEERGRGREEGGEGKREEEGEEREEGGEWERERKKGRDGKGD